MVTFVIAGGGILRDGEPFKRQRLSNQEEFPPGGH